MKSDTSKLRALLLEWLKATEADYQTDERMKLILRTKEAIK